MHSGLEAPFSELSEPDLSRLAESLVYVRPLQPYPGWHFGTDWENPDPGFQTRTRLWDYCHNRKRPLPVVMDWYASLRIKLHLGNDLSRQLFVTGCIDPNELFLLDKLLSPGMTFVDAGANEGLYSLFASRRVGGSGVVWAFEPSEREFIRLDENLSLNRLANVRAFQLALSNRNGEQDLAIAEPPHEGQNTLGAFIYEDAQLLRKERVAVRKLDDLAVEHGLSRLDVMKIDVEGAEFRLLDGARRVLQQMRPVVLFEFLEEALQNQGCSGDKLLALLASFDYRIYEFDETTGLPAPAEGRPLGLNPVAAPAERMLSEG